MINSTILKTGLELDLKLLDYNYQKILTRTIVTCLSCVGLILGIEPASPAVREELPSSFPPALAKRGDFSYPTNPTNDRAIGYLLKGKIKSCILNYGDFIDIDVDRDGSWDTQPAGLWGEYAYLPQVGFLAGVPGMEYSSKFNWNVDESFDGPGVDYIVWSSNGAYREMVDIGMNTLEDTTYNFVGVVFEAYEDDGIVGTKVDSISSGTGLPEFTGANQWFVSHDEGNPDTGTPGDPNAGYLMISIPADANADPGRSNAYLDPDQKKAIGLIYPWALRPALSQRRSGSLFDDYDYSGCSGFNEDWDGCFNLEYYGATVSESWLTRGYNTDWQPTTGARNNTHQQIETAGDIFGDTDFTDPTDPYPLLAHSNYSQTWPTNVSSSGELIPFWPGWWADIYVPEETGCVPITRKNPDCWVEATDTHVSDSDIYMQFDDRWAHRGNSVNSTGDKYIQKGYPLGLKVEAMAHSYQINFSEDIMFVTVRVRNESGDWKAFRRENINEEKKIFKCSDPTVYSQQACLDAGGTWGQLEGDGIILPDGSKINGGKGYNYKKVSLGFYVDADIYSQTITGSTSGRSPADDFMERYEAKYTADSLIISLALFYDKDGNHIIPNPEDVGIVAVQLLDTPVATDTLYYPDGSLFRLPGQKLKITDWHWFDWMNRPGVKYPGIEPPRADNKEEIQYKLMSGDTTNLKSTETSWFFHSANPAIDQAHPDFDPHFDSIDGLELEHPDGLDCVNIFSTGPFDIAVGEEVPFSFTIIFGEDKEDLINNAEFAQIMYNSHYQGFSAPAIPVVVSKTSKGRVELYWDGAAELAKDVVTGYSDFEGYKIYKSINRGKTWGTTADIVKDFNGREVGWRPYAQFDLSAISDTNFCVYGLLEGENSLCVQADDCSDYGCIRSREISGIDQEAEWLYIGQNTGFEDILMDTTDWFTIMVDGDSVILKYRFVDTTNVIDGFEYSYSVTSYDMGIENPDDTTKTHNSDGTVEITTEQNKSNPARWDVYQSIETGRGTTIHDKNFVSVVPGVLPDESLSKVWVVPNPYIVHSQFLEGEFFRSIRFTNLSEHCEITIFTIMGEKVNSFRHDSETDGNEWWNLRTMNNQEISPGLYIFHVKSDNGKEFIGKFAVVR